ncbi:hypothetical protein CRENPOLYSF1_10063 [Crenothrix polyspora]|uniref:Uncharacterized protein n=1 Tax=Crenothrix polyspora TaxID=360316 RepID=A0A1R4GYL8_9GAMM|nr:hypothetical protein CRENPOLYSF1_10063 [Crenothrix polyspora]
MSKQITVFYRIPALLITPALTGAVTKAQAQLNSDDYLGDDPVVNATSVF